MERRYVWKNSKNIAQNTKLAQQLAQKDYIEKFLPAARKERDILAEFITKYNLNNTETLYTSFSKQRQALIAPAILSDSEYTKRWEAQCVMQKQNIKSNFNYHHYALDEDTGFSTEKEHIEQPTPIYLIHS